MSNRHQRRTDLRDFKRDARDHVVTHLVEANDALDGHPLLRHAVSFWRGNIQQRRPFCPACKANFADDAHPAAFLLATPPVAPTSASLTAFCAECWRSLTITEIERACACSAGGGAGRQVRAASGHAAMKLDTVAR